MTARTNAAAITRKSHETTAVDSPRLAFAAEAADTASQAAETDEAKFIRLIDQLEQDPLGDQDKRIATG